MEDGNWFEQQLETALQLSFQIGRLKSLPVPPHADGTVKFTLNALDQVLADLKTGMLSLRQEQQDVEMKE